MAVDQDKRVRRRRRSRPPSHLRTIWDNYKVELFGLVVAAFGLFLLVERVSLRRSLTAWARATVAGLSSRFHDLENQALAFLAHVSLSDLIGAVLFVAAIAALLLRLRWRLLNSESLTNSKCPKCGGAIDRVHRRWYDRLICLYVPVRRYRCRTLSCRWRGLRVGSHHTPVQRRPSLPVT